MRAFKVVALAIAAGAFVVPARADTPWVDTDQMSVATQLATAIGSTGFCNFGVNTDGLAAAIKDRIAPTGKLTPEMASHLMFYVVATQGLQVALSGVSRMNKRQLAQHCAQLLSTYGPNGSQVKGLVTP